MNEADLKRIESWHDEYQKLQKQPEAVGSGAARLMLLKLRLLNEIPRLLLHIQQLDREASGLAQELLKRRQAAQPAAARCTGCGALLFTNLQGSSCVELTGKVFCDCCIVAARERRDRRAHS